MDAIWVVVITTLLAFCVTYAYKLGFKRGYRAGGIYVLKEWTKFINDKDIDV